MGSLVAPDLGRPRPLLALSSPPRVAHTHRRYEEPQNTHEGDRLVQQALRKTLYVKFKIRDNDVFEKALGYIREYY